MNPKVSIIVPIYNTSNLLSKCINSIIKQTHQNLEIILVDDGSTDNSGSIIDEYAEKDNRIKVIHQKNHGQSNARNTGLKHITGDYIGFIDSDDMIKPNFIKTLLSLYGNDNNTSITVCGHEYRYIKKNITKSLYNSPLKPRRDNESVKAYILKLLAKDGRMYSCNNKLFRTSIIKKHHLSFDESINFAEDTKFVLTYLLFANGEIAYSPKPLYIYNYGTETSTIVKSSTVWSNWQKSYKFLKKWVGNKSSLSEKFWLFMILCRWRISYVRSIKRAKD